MGYRALLIAALLTSSCATAKPPATPATRRAGRQNRPPSVRGHCAPCTVTLGKTSTLTADAQDPDGDALTYVWSTPAGALTNAAGRQTPWTAPMLEGPVPVAVRVTDPSGAFASDVVTIQVIKEEPDRRAAKP